MRVDEAAGALGVAGDELRHWQQLGLLAASDELSEEDVERARLVCFVARRGISADELARICDEKGDVLATFVRWFLRPGRGAALSPTEALSEPASTTRRSTAYGRRPACGTRPRRT